MAVDNDFNTFWVPQVHPGTIQARVTCALHLRKIIAKKPRLPIGSRPTPLDQVHFPPGTDRYSSNRNTAASRTGGGGNENQVGLLIYTIL